MKKLVLFAFAALALAACSDEVDAPTPAPKPDLSCPATHTQTISFEDSEGLKDIEDVAVKSGEIEVVGGSAAGKFSNVFWVKSISNYESYLDKGVYNGGYLFSTADGNSWFGANFNNTYGADYWDGFVLTSNYGKTATKLDYANQFTVRGDQGANGTKNCLIGYDGSYVGNDVRPTIDFAITPLTPCHCYMANTELTYPYTPMTVELSAYYYKVVVIGLLKGVETGRVECKLIEGGKPVEGWIRVDLSTLGTVDCLKFEPDSNERNDFGMTAPAYFALDEIGFVAEK